MKIYIVNGFPGCGKTSFENFVYKYMGPFCKQFSTIDFVKEIARDCGWDGTKSPKNRKFLSDLKALLTEWDDIPNKMVEKKIKDFQSDLDFYEIDGTRICVFIDCREPEEIDKLKKRLGAKTIFISREQHEDGIINSSDANVDQYKYDIIINNNGDLKSLENRAIVFIQNESLKVVKDFEI